MKDPRSKLGKQLTNRLSNSQQEGLLNIDMETQNVSLSDLNESIQVETCSISIVKGDQKGNVFSLSKDVIRVGAHPRCDIQIVDGTVSRFHCEIHRDQDGYRLIDEGSTNGTYVGDLRIRDIYLSAGREFQIGNTTLSFSPITEQISLTDSPLEQLGPLIGGSRQMRKLYTLIQKVAPSDLSVVIEGETGTGKELVAQAIHQLSRRSEKDLIVFDCSAVPEHLIESELFGHEKGAFSGAVRAHAGLFEQADGGTLFLDELGELPTNLQPKLLRALESGIIRRVGGESVKKVDVRAISATNRDLGEMVKLGSFRQDLYYRLAKVKVTLPPLKERRGDPSKIAKYFLDVLNKKNEGYKHIKGITPNALHRLEGWEWPGNVRELRNMIERAYTFADREMIHSADLMDQLDPEHLDDDSYLGGVHTPLEIPDNFSLKEAKERIIESFEKDYLQQLLVKNEFNISAVSRDAGIDRRHVYRLIKKYEIVTP